MGRKLIKNVSILAIMLTFVILIVSKDFLSSIRISLIYCIFFYAPSLILIQKMKLNSLEKFTISNLIGLSYGSIYFLLDVLFKVPLSNITFILVTVVFYIFAIYINKKTKIEKNESISNI